MGKEKWTIAGRCARGVLVIMAGVLGITAGWCIQTEDVELGYGGVYDGSVHIERSPDGQMLFRDNVVSGATTLDALTRGVSHHWELEGLNGDDHTQYLNAERHGSAHSASFNADLPIPPDTAGNTRLGEHVEDSDIHLKRDETVEITGDWRFSGTPRIWNGLRFSNGGQPGNVALDFQSLPDDARILWDQANGQFVLNRNARFQENLSAREGSIDRSLSIGGSFHGHLASPVSGTEFLLLGMDDQAASPVVLDSAGGQHNQTLQTSGGNLNTSTRSVPGVVGNALHFEKPDFINLGKLLDPFLAQNQDFCIAFWWKSSGAAETSTDHLAGNRPVDDVIGVYWYTYNGNLYSRVRSGAFSHLQTWSGGDDGLWHHYLTQRRGTRIEIWRDGILFLSSDAAENAGSVKGGDFFIGKAVTGGPATGVMDDFRVYGRALSSGEVAALARGTASRSRMLAAIDGALSLNQLGVDGRITSGALQVSQGAWCDGNTWISLSTEAAKTNIQEADSIAQWDRLDKIQVVEFAYRKRNPDGAVWLDPRGEPVRPGDPAHEVLHDAESILMREMLIEQGYRLENPLYLDEPEEHRQLGFIAEDLRQVAPMLSRGSGIAAIDISAFNTAILQEARRRIEDLEERLRALENQLKP